MVSVDDETCLQEANRDVRRGIRSSILQEGSVVASKV